MIVARNFIDVSSSLISVVKQIMCVLKIKSSSIYQEIFCNVFCYRSSRGCSERPLQTLLPYSASIPVSKLTWKGCVI